MSDSLIRSSLRSFLIAFFAFMGFFFSLLVLGLVFSTYSANDDEVPNDFSPEIQANAKGVRKKLSKTAPVILELDIKGTIGTLELTQRVIENLLIESRENSLKNERVKGILVNINSPGGTVSDADGIYRALLNYKSLYNVPIYAYADGLCASGGMYVACGADKIYASDVSLIGSIGVITPPFVNISQLMEKLGVNALTLYAGKGKDDLNPTRPWTPDEDKNLKSVIDYYYNSFVDIVVKHRQVTKEALVKDYGANIFPAEQAVKMGLIDGANETRESTLKKLLASISIEDDFYQVISLKSTNWFNQLVNTKCPLSMKHEIILEGQLPKELLGKPLYLYRP